MQSLYNNAHFSSIICNELSEGWRSYPLAKIATREYAPNMNGGVRNDILYLNHPQTILQWYRCLSLATVSLIRPTHHNQEKLW